jgi:hypothetical protein
MKSMSWPPVLNKASIAVLSRKWKLGKAQAESMPKGELVFTLGVHDDTDNMSLCCLNYLSEGIIQEWQAIENIIRTRCHSLGPRLSPMAA